MKRRGHRVTREAEASVEGDGQCVSLVLLSCQCRGAFEGLKQGSGLSDPCPRKSYDGKMFIQANRSEESQDPRKIFSHL